MNLEKQTVLIVDDTQFNIKIIEDILKDDYQVVSVTSGEKCMEYVISNPVDLILLDVIMPEIDGYEVCRQLKANPITKKIPVVFLSVKGEVKDETKGLELGAIDYITKCTCAAIIKARIKNYLELKKNSDILEKFSFIDGLTGLFNRRYLDDAIAKEWKCALRNGNMISVLLIDIDFFKKYNDFYGHVEGDKCLQKVASVLTNSILRPEDIVTRYGGEEFIVILPSTPKNGAIKVAKRIQDKLSLLKIPHLMSESDKCVTVSIGIATVMPKDYIHEKVLIEKADFAMYQAKNRGRKRFIAIDNP
jgi:diguanylate cyclase (GGDEF)-like protein